MSLAEEMALAPSVPGGMVTYRRTLTISLFFKFYLTVQHQLARDVSVWFHKESAPAIHIIFTGHPLGKWV